MRSRQPGEPARPIALVTGGSSGIGRAAVLELARAGFDVGFTYRAREREALELVRAVCELGARAHCRRLDLAAAADDGGRVVEQLAAALGGVDVLVNNAAVNTRGGVLEQSLGDWRATLEVNLLGPFACGQAAARAMVASGRGGAIVNVSSVVGQVPLPEAAAYCAAKAGLDMLTRVMAIELAPHAIRVNAVAPGHTVTPMNYAEADAVALDANATTWPQIPLGRSADPAEIARAIVFLASPAASYATGTTLLVDGGLALVAGPGLLQAATGLPPEGTTPRWAATERPPEGRTPRSAATERPTDGQMPPSATTFASTSPNAST